LEPSVMLVKFLSEISLRGCSLLKHT